MNFDWVRFDDRVCVGMDRSHFYVAVRGAPDDHMVYWGVRHIMVPVLFPFSPYWHWRPTYQQAKRVALRLANGTTVRASKPNARLEQAKREFAA